MARTPAPSRWELDALAAEYLAAAAERRREAARAAVTGLLPLDEHVDYPVGDDGWPAPDLVEGWAFHVVRP